MRTWRCCAAAGSGDGVEVDVVHHHAVDSVLERHFDGIADAYTNKRSRHLLVEGPVAIGGAVIQLASYLDGIEVDLDRLWPSATDRPGEVGGIADDIGHWGRSISCSGLVGAMLLGNRRTGCEQGSCGGSD